MTSILTKSIISLAGSADIKSICEPIFNKLQLNHLNYIHLNTDNSVSYLCSNHGWIKTYLENNYYKIGAFEQRKDLRNFHFVLWSALEDDPVFKYTREVYGVYHGITLIKKHRESWSFYNFGSQNNNPAILNVLVNSINILEHFCNEFQKKARRLIHLANQNKIIIHPKLAPMAKKNALLLDVGLASQSPKEPRLLTKVELLCIRLYLRGIKSKDISKMLNISHRTVEKHIENIKKKLNCKSQLQLGYTLARMGIEMD